MSDVLHRITQTLKLVELLANSAFELPAPVSAQELGRFGRGDRPFKIRATGIR